MSDEEVMPFEVTDYDVEHEFSQHRVRKLTKHQQIYGVWADEEDDSEDESRTRARFSKKKKDYTAPVNFVAGGIHQPSQKSKEDEAKESEHEVEDEDIITDSSDEDIRPSFSGQAKKAEVQTPFFAESETAGLRRMGQKPNSLGMDQGIANWEKHNKGIGSKLMLQMGYQPGRGLGKELQGIDAPIEAHLRKGRGAIGAYGPEKKQKKMTGNEALLKENQLSEEKSERASLWRKEATEKTKKTRYVYKSVDDVIEESKKLGKKKFGISELSKVKVIDMTGPEQRILSGYHAIAGVQRPAEEWDTTRKDKKFNNFSVPELLHNLNLLVDVSEQAIIENDRKLMYADDRCKVLEDQVKNFGPTVKQEKYIIDKLQVMIDALESVIPSENKDDLTLEKAEDVFSSLKDNHYAEFRAYEIPQLAVNIVRPLFSTFLENWKPLQEPKIPIPEFVKWRSILLLDDTPNQTMNSYKLNPYYKLVWDTWVPRVRTAISNWECRQWAPMVDVIMNWTPLLSNWILDNILQDMILKRIQQQVDDWNPLTDPVPIHSWIYPWINLLGKSFETSVYPVIRQKIGRALVNWHPSDSSVRVMLRPWMSVFERGAMEAFLVTYIVPKLEVTLGQEFVINPHQQCLDQWNWVMGWSEMIPPHTMAALLDRSFFPKWLQTLSVWLNMNPDMDQVSKWFRGWETVIPENVREQPAVRDHLCTAVEIMNGAAEGANVISEPRLTRKMAEPVEAIRPLEVPLTLKSIVQNRCEERGILWMPVPNRFMEAKQVYRCGKLQVYFDRNALLVSQGGGAFTPMSWQEMLENAI